MFCRIFKDEIYINIRSSELILVNILLFLLSLKLSYQLYNCFTIVRYLFATPRTSSDRLVVTLVVGCKQLRTLIVFYLTGCLYSQVFLKVAFLVYFFSRFLYLTSYLTGQTPTRPSQMYIRPLKFRFRRKVESTTYHPMSITHEQFISLKINNF